MNYKLSELKFKQGNTLFKMGLYNDSIKSYDEALKIKVNHKYYYNKAVALQRLGQHTYMEIVLKQAIDSIQSSKEKENKEILKIYEKKLLNVKNRDKPLIWWDWWFNKSNILKKIFGGLLCLGLIIFIFTPIVIVPLCINYDWLSVEKLVNWGGWWVWYLVPIIIFLILLLSPGIRGISTQGLEMDLSMLRREEESLETFEKFIESPTIPEKRKKK